MPALLSGKAKPADAVEQVILAQLCQLHKKRYAAAARFYADAFAAQPAFADDLKGHDRYNPPSAAALAGCGQGNDAAKLDPKERARLRRQALDWLRQDLKTCRRGLERSAGKLGPVIAHRMAHLLKDDDFAGVRGVKALAALPATERDEWRKLWQEVEALRRHAANTRKAP